MSTGIVSRPAPGPDLATDAALRRTALLALVPPAGWRTPARVRLPPLAATEARPGQRLLMSLISRIGKLDAGNLWRMLMRNPRLLPGFLALASRLMPYGELPRSETELVILRVAWNCRCRYEWGQHVDIGLRAGLAAADIARLPQGPDAAGWTSRQLALLLAADDMHRERMLSDSTWERLADFLDQRRLLELLMLIGFYEGLAGVLNSAGLPLDATLEHNPG